MTGNAPAPRLTEAMLLGNPAAARERLNAVLLYASIRHYDRFAAERAAAIQFLTTATPCSEEVRRAAFWEPNGPGSETPGSVALRRLASCPDQYASRLLVERFLLSNARDGFSELGRRVKAGDRVVITGLLNAAEIGCNDSAAWPARVMALAGDIRVMPLLTRCLSAPQANNRRLAAWNLAEIPRAEGVEPLIDAIHAETDVEARQSELAALGEIGSSKALDTLLEAASLPFDEWTMIRVVRGIARIRDTRGLKVLAAIAIRTKDDSPLAWEAVNGFGYISGLYLGYPPATVGTGGFAGLKVVHQRRDAITAWQKSQP